MRGWRALALAAVAGVSGCTTPLVSPVPLPRPAAAVPVPPSLPEPVLPSVDSAELSQRYERIENGFLVRDMLRRDGGGVDTPFTPRQLADTFLTIALFAEYDAAGRPRPVETRLNRWTGPVPLSIEFGDGVSPDRQVTDRNAVLGFARRLTRHTGIAFPTASEDAAKMTVLVLTEADRRAAGPRLRRLLPNLNPAEERRVLALDPDTYCIAITHTDAATQTYSHAVIVIRDELPDLMRLSCIHEEMAQAMGLPNDSPRARPSIFNDDEEFALLTTHDEFLLQILYSDALAPGMSLQEAAPKVKALAETVMAPKVQ